MVRPHQQRETAVEHYAGIDVSLEQSKVCMIDAGGGIVREATVASEPAALAAWFTSLEQPPAVIGLEAGPLSQWLHGGLTAAGFDVVLLETRHVKAALSAMVVKTDRKDASGIAQLLRMGWFRPVHCKSPGAQERRALLKARKQLQEKAIDVELSIRGLLRGFGLKLGRVSPGRFEQRVRELAHGQPTLEEVMDAMLAARAALRDQLARLDRQVRAIVREDATCRLLMTAPGVGAVVALTYTAGVDDPARFRRSKAVGAHFGLTPRRYQSGQVDVTGRISKVGDAMVRAALYEAAQVMLTRTRSPSALKSWAMRIARRRGGKRAIVALARKLAVVLHRMWVDGTAFRYTKEESAKAA